MRLDVTKSVKFPLNDPSWPVKLGIGLLMQLLGFLIVPMLAFSGYMLQVVRDAANGNDENMPEWGDWGRLIMQGLMVSLASLIYMLIPMGLIIFGMGSFIASIIFGASRDSAVTGLAGGAMSLGLGGVGLLLLLVVCFLLPALMIRYATSGDFGSFFQVGQAVSDIMTSPIDYLMVVIVPIGLSGAFSFVVGLTGGLLAILSPVFVVITSLVGAHLAGDYYRNCLQS